MNLAVRILLEFTGAKRAVEMAAREPGKAPGGVAVVSAGLNPPSVRALGLALDLVSVIFH